jgi:hypothetical protein
LGPLNGAEIFENKDIDKAESSYSSEYTDESALTIYSEEEK